MADIKGVQFAEYCSYKEFQLGQQVRTHLNLNGGIALIETRLSDILSVPLTEIDPTAKT